MGALEKFKHLFFGVPSKKKPKNKKVTKKKNLKLVKTNPSQQNSDKRDIQILQAQIHKKIQSDPEMAKKATMIIEKMIKKK